ncbi:MAG: hypothetical protein KAT69_07765 [Candidatus Aminicenantes bacterium]|nr:hypothetical protein [Candidatus Aminicenantes bacterium]
MTFDEWHKKNFKNGIKGGYKPLSEFMEDAWNAAIDEAVKVAKETDCMGCESFLADQIKKLNNA